MGEILPRHYLFGIIMFVFVIMAGVGIISEIQKENHGYALDTNHPGLFKEYNDTFNVYSDMTSEVTSLRENIEGSKAEMGTFGVLGSLIKSSWNTVKFLLGGLNFMETSIKGMTTIFGIPVWIPSLIISGITIIFIFAIFSLIFRQKI